MLPLRYLHRAIRAFALSALGALLAASAAHAQIVALQDVVKTNPLLPRTDLTGVVYFNGEYIATGPSGNFTGSNVFISVNGTDTWATQKIAQTANLHGLAANSTLLVAVGNDTINGEVGGVVFTSTNGLTWSENFIGAPFTLNSVEWTGTNFIATGDQGEIALSQDGANWTYFFPSAVTSLNPTAPPALRGVTSTVFPPSTDPNAPNYIAVGNQSAIINSLNGLSWTLAQAPQPANLTSVAFATLPDTSTLLIAVGNLGNVITSVDQGVNWAGGADLSSLGNLTKVRFLPSTGNFFILSDQGNIEVTDGTFSGGPAAFNATAILRDVTVNPTTNQAVAVGALSSIITSPDQTIWTPFFPGVYNNFLSIASNGTTLMEVGNNAVIYSNDGGNTWATNRFSDTSNVTLAARAVVWATGGPAPAWLATGDNAATGGFASNTTLMSSLDGLTWTASAFRTTRTMRGLAWSGGTAGSVWAAGDGGTILKSSDFFNGTSWTQKAVNTTTANLEGVAASPNGDILRTVIVCGGANGTVVTSFDAGDTWSAQNLAVTPSVSTGNRTFHGAAYHNNFFVLVGDGGTIYYSPDLGESWVQGNTGGTQADFLSVSHTGKYWVALGNDGNAYLSIDPTFWAKCPGPEPAGVGLQTGVGADLAYVFVSSNGNTFTSTLPDPTTIPPVTIVHQPVSVVGVGGKGVSLSALGSAGGSPVFYQWQFNGNNLAAGGSFTGVNSPTLTLKPAQAFFQGTYSVVISNGLKSVTSGAVTLTLNFPPVISTQPVNQTVAIGQRVVFSAGGAGSAPLKFKWYWSSTRIKLVTHPHPKPGQPASQITGVLLKNNQGVSGAARPTLILTSVSPKRKGYYVLVVTNPYGQVLSANAKLIVRRPH